MGDVEGGHLSVGDGDAFRIEVVVDLAEPGEAGLGGGRRDQIDDDAIADERAGAPVLADEGEEAVLDLVPLAGARRQVVDGDVEADLVGEPLQLAFPQAHTRSIAAAAPGLRRGMCGWPPTRKQKLRWMCASRLQSCVRPL